ncbi:cobalt-precorrin-5B (C(1))-methyltransferase CbiD [Fuchsiella alkaliacetigena]|uniref:cobalt-precorrin-5B (C(1))-methyltransferase CbiD n=1 Tax=Fuchsiella alkaliacetigena TaxID=957042 RepID=UPI00200B0383|nr:cobalt-precorrin-5B (C(1))-methyltransferase CbiD [Fuchsiella alkaliacetigena]MCK8825529.1 cobalt-precorrin-5B (C(1))-methyltransferase CbiD [Fuchsiella alkaliacetigena]
MVIFESYIERGGKKLRRGYTTGTAAAGAAKAATETLFSGQVVEEVKVDTPAGIVVNLVIQKVEEVAGEVSCTVIKDGGDDPDITHGLEIVAVATEIESGIEIEGGQGVGRVTKPGLPVEVGKPAINPVPRKMILEQVKQALPSDKGVQITIEVPAGEKKAQKTLNPRLGIEGGISILGTTGIVEPMSKKAFRESLVLAIDQALAQGYQELVFIFGNYGKRQAEAMGVATDRWVKMSNFVGYMLDRALEKGVKKIILLGHLGKLVKVAAGIFDTHSSVADARMETIAAYAASQGATQKLVQEILAANTSEECIEILQKADFNKPFFDLLAAQVVKRAKQRVEEEIEIGAILFSMAGDILGKAGVELEVKEETAWQIKFTF